MNPGRHNRRVTIQKIDPNATTNASGHVDLSDDNNWTDYATRWGQKLTSSSREVQRARQVQADLTVRFKFQYDPEVRDITPEMRIKDEDDSILQIIGAYDPDSTKRQITIDCKQPE